MSLALVSIASRSTPILGLYPAVLREATRSLDASQLQLPTAMTQARPYGGGGTTIPSYASHTAATAGRKSNVFRPPATPTASASSSAYLTKSSMSLTSDADHSGAMSRKRTRYEYTASSITPVSIMADWPMGDAGEMMARSGSIDMTSPAPFVNTRYHLKGGLDTPGAAAANAREAAESEYHESGFRKDLGGGMTADEQLNFSFFPRIDAPLSASSGLAGYIPSPKREGWSKAAFEVAGAVVGKVWQFTTAPFRGFIAGGGTAYTPTARPMTPTQENLWREDYANQDRNSTPIPGQFPKEDFIPNYIDNPTPRDERGTPQRPAKRRQISGNHQNESIGDLEKNWIMVQHGDEYTSLSSKESRPKLKAAANIKPSLNRRLTGQPVSRASHTSMRRSAVPRCSNTGVSHAGSPGLTSRSGASFASPRSPGGSRIPILSYQPSYSLSPSKLPRPSRGGDGSRPESPAAVDVSRFAARRKMEEKEFDEATRKLNKQLRDMIKEGKEALGSKVEIVDSEEEDFEDGY